MKTYIVLNKNLHPDDIDFVFGIFQADSVSKVEEHINLDDFYDYKDFDIIEEKIKRLK